MILREYQEAAVTALIDRLSECPLLCLPTGAGKTVVFVEVVRRLNVRALLIVHRRELITQAATRFKAAGIETGIVLAGYPSNPSAQMQIGSIQTLGRRPPLRGIQLCISDEAHLSAAKIWAKVLASYDCPRIGVTGTPARLDGKPLGAVYGCIIEPATTAELCAQGFLLAPKVYSANTPDLSDVRIVKGDFDHGQLEKAMSSSILVGDIPRTWLAKCPGKKTVAFAVGIAHSKSIVEAFTLHGVPAAHIDAKTPYPERAKALRDLADHRIQVLSQVGIVQEGWDLPSLEVCIHARPTASLVLWRQSIGRIMRSTEGKEGCILLDHSGNYWRHGKVTDPQKWSLTDTIKPRRDSAVKGRKCPQCLLVLRPGAPSCTECGYIFPPPKGRKMVEVEGELVSVDDTPRDVAPYAERAAFWEKLEADRLIAGGNKGRDYYAYLSKYHHAPVVVNGRLVNTDNPTEDERREVFKKFAREVLQRDSIKVGYAAARFKSCFGSWPPFAWSRALEKKRAEVQAQRLALLTSAPTTVSG